ncbi:MAG TPA: TonB family protein [Vicinamibacterales bacterium]|nr:TonB family protein [Vicinamibacterales bacterium]
MKLLAVVAAVGALTVSLVAQADIDPARFASGAIPVVPVRMTAAGDVIVSATVSEAGTVTAVDVLRSTPPLTDAVLQAARGWRFSPALDSTRKPMESHVLIEMLSLAPSLYTPTVGTPPKDVAGPDPRTPYPARTQVPLYPVNARTEGSVLVEGRVDPAGHVVGVTAVRSAPPFDTVALDAVRSWTFRPAQGPKVPLSTYVYVVFAFRQPLVGTSPPLGTSTPPTPPTP